MKTGNELLGKVFPSFLFSVLLTFSVYLHAQNSAEIQNLTPRSFLNVYKSEHKYFFAIPDSVFDRDILVVSRIVYSSDSLPHSSLSNEFRGATTLEEIIRFSKKNDTHVSLLHIDYARHSTAHPRSRRVPDGQRITELMEFSRSQSEDGKTILFDGTKLLDGKNDILFINDFSKRALKITSNVYTKLKSVDGFEDNIDLHSIGIRGQSMLYELNTSLFLLPELAMRPRFEQRSLNYFSVKNTHFDSLQKRYSMAMITRWRIEPKNEDREKFKHGILVEPRKPIVFYIDSTAPKKLIPYLKNAVADWNKAFEKIGFKNAIIVREINPSDSQFSLFNIKHSLIHFLNSDIRNGSYSNIVDPRSGEIIQSHIQITTGGILDQCENYFVQASPYDARARKPLFPDSLIGILAQGYLSHEIGHALGLDHNMVANDYTPVEKLRDNKWLMKHNHTISIMDYARFNYVAQVGDKVQSGIGGVGEYDYWAVKWGYTYFPSFISQEKETELLTKWVRKKSNNKKYRYLSGINSDDPRLTPEALSDEITKAADYGIINLKYIMSHLIEWVVGSGGNNEQLAAVYSKIETQFNNYLDHVSANIGGVYDSVANQPSSPVPGKIQEHSIDFICGQIFVTPHWLISPEVLSKIRKSDSLIIGRLQSGVLQKILSTRVFVNLMKAADWPKLRVPSIADFLSTLSNEIFSKLDPDQRVDKFSQLLQVNYLKSLIYTIRPLTRYNWPTGTSTEEYSFITSMVKSELNKIGNKLDQLLLSNSAEESIKTHFRNLKMLTIFK